MLLLKSFLRCWVLPPGFVYLLAIWVAGMIRGRHFSTLKQYLRHRDKLFVLATGPSLSVDYPRYGDEIEKCDVAVMNFFADSPLFLEVKPQLYFLADPLFFTSFAALEKDGRGNQRIHVESFCNNLVKSVDWEMTLVVPDVARRSEFVAHIGLNNNIHVLYYNSRLGMDWTTKIEMWMVKRQWISPPAWTVANLSVGLGVVMGYREVWLLGADTSMHTMMRVDQVTNELYLENSHFYGDNKEKVRKSGIYDNPSTVASWLSAISKMFAGYERIRSLADYCGVKVVNASSYSWIDSLDRAAK